MVNVVSKQSKLSALALLCCSTIITVRDSFAFQVKNPSFSFSHQRRRRRRRSHQFSFNLKMKKMKENNKWIVRSLTTSTPDPNTKTDAAAAAAAPRNSNDPSVVVPTRLIVHLDINETILLGDDAGGDTRHDSVQKMLAKSAFCKLPGTKETSTTSPSSSSSSWESTQQVEPTHWWDGQRIGEETSIPPLYTGWTWPENCCPYYRTKFKELSKNFVSVHGRIYQPILDECEKELAKTSGTDHILPAFYQILYHFLNLYQTNNKQTTKQDDDTTLPFALVFRTFGSDVDEIAQLLTKFAIDNNFPPLELPPEKLFQGRWKEGEDGSVVYQLWNRDQTKLVASGDEEILKLLKEGSCFGIRDDYDYWRQNEWLPTAGKPIWIPHYNEQSTFDHHLFFDDNIHNLSDDGIACVRRQQADGTFVTVDGTKMHQESQGVHLIRVPTIEPVLNPKWFVEKIESAQVRLQERLKKQ